MDCMGTPTWVRHVQQQENEWSSHEWHSSCPVSQPAHPAPALCTEAACQHHSLRTWQELARWALAAQSQQASAVVPASAPVPDSLPRAAAKKRAHEHGEEQAKRSRPLAELQA